MLRKVAVVFEVGKSYSFATENERGFGTASYKVVAWEHPLVKLTSAGEREVLLNVMSSRFHSAKPVDHDASAPVDFNIVIAMGDER